MHGVDVPEDANFMLAAVPEVIKEIPDKDVEQKASHLRRHCLFGKNIQGDKPAPEAACQKIATHHRKRPEDKTRDADQKA